MTATEADETYDLWLRRLDEHFADFDQVLDDHVPRPEVEERGRVVRIDGGIVEVSGLPGVGSEELVRFAGDRLGMAFDLRRDAVGVILLDEMTGIDTGSRVRRTGQVMSTPVGEAVLGRVIDPTGRPLDGLGPVETADHLPVERPAPEIMDRDPVEAPLQTGIKAIDALIPIGRGQRELILGDRQTGKTSIAVDTIINQRDQGVVCIYSAIGMRSSAVAKLVADLRANDALSYTAVVVTTGEDPAGRQFIAPYAATSMAEFFMERGDDVLIVYDDLTRHARSYRELSLLLRRPPAREAYPGDIFYIHSRLLERPTRLSEERGGGSMTALPIIETQAENISAYIPTNLVSITDGQIYVSPRLFRKGVLPAIDIGRSVSRVGGKAQLPAFRAVAGDLRLSYSQFEELERFSRYGARLESSRRDALERGRRVREVLKQPLHEPLDVAQQVALLAAVTSGVFDSVRIDDMPKVSERVKTEVVARLDSLFRRVVAGEKLDADDLEQIRGTASDVVSEAT